MEDITAVKFEVEVTADDENKTLWFPLPLAMAMPPSAKPYLIQRPNWSNLPLPSTT
ncbi:hypothetical protein MTR_1g095260 [Medicago truncatula]|uniref:Uncharacterized protein n=1 Tax=Medicago truncatula TaxID=3880 RepID=G7I3B3_MEDTR|nr:hypothetical protein MTR_1g095260 [Medicago truncatula]